MRVPRKAHHLHLISATSKWNICQVSHSYSLIFKHKTQYDLLLLLQTSWIQEMNSVIRASATKSTVTHNMHADCDQYYDMNPWVNSDTTWIALCTSHNVDWTDFDLLAWNIVEWCVFVFCLRSSFSALSKALIPCIDVCGSTGGTLVYLTYSSCANKQTQPHWIFAAK